jgi:hypothetical protein
VSYNNPGVFNAATVGFMAGVYQQRYPYYDAGEAYDAIIAQAELYGVVVDSLIPPGSPSQAYLDAIRDLTANAVATRFSTNIPESGLTQLADAIAAAVNELELTLAPAPPPPYVPTPTAIQYLSSTSASKQIVVSGPDQPVNLDTRTAPFTAVMPTAASCSDGQKASALDGYGSWGTSAPSVSIETGTSMQSPTNPVAAPIAGPATVQMPAVAYGSAKWILEKELTTSPLWKLAS